MIVEATKMTGNGKLVLTGQLGDVMKESATLALSWIRANSKKVRKNKLDNNSGIIIFGITKPINVDETSPYEHKV